MESKDIEIGDLKYLEEDLSRDELVSVAFLLYGGEKPKWILDKLENNPGKPNLLEEFAKSHVNWKLMVIEALAVVQVFECLKNLGVSAAEAREFVRKSELINPGLKLLYELCEILEKDTTDKFINFIKEQCNSAAIENVGQLEIFLLHAIVDEKIKIMPSLDACDFALIHQFKNVIASDNSPVDEIFEKFPSKPNTLDNSNNSNFNNSSETQLRATEQIQVALANTLLDSYATKKMLVLIINQQTFVRATNVELIKMMPDHNLTERKGTTKDMEALQALFESFKYHVITKSDLTHVEILREVDKTTKQSSKFDGLIVCVLSHGHEGIFYGSDSIPVFVKDIKETMSSKILLDKPKIIFIQACQGSNLQRSVKKIIPLTEHDGPSQSSLVSGSTRADFLIFWSTIEGFASVRHVETGSWFIQALVQKIRESCKGQNLLDICTAVIKEVSSKRGYRDECMLPKLESTFTRNFRFP
jgi:caspase 8